ncbi:hypothetical protein VNO77_28607 [Canavalia gladiata]|uniref:Gnk2-homologous domain-containing protein n=1 Tax=Canavalia gladiata TaxID=3824 RepID=A0AAN9L0I0_CANGL
MCSSKVFTNFLFLVSLALLVQSSFGANPLGYSSLNSENFTAGSSYESNLNTLIRILIYRTHLKGFMNYSEGNFQFTQKAYGLTLCRGDVSVSECKTCVSEATKEIRKQYPYNKGAIIWYDNCMFRYSDEYFFGNIGNYVRLYMWNVKDASDPATFNQNTKQLLSQLAQQAFSNPKLYATGEQNLDNFVLYGLTQCTRDLSSTDCKNCLDTIINELPNCCNRKEGGRILGESCNFRYEIYPFFVKK